MPHWKMNGQRFLLQNVLNIKYFPARKCSKLPEGIKYYGFTFYPRRENFKDPPYEPSKLFLIRRVKSLKGTNKIEKKALEVLNIDGDKNYYGNINVVKNVPTTNALLWKVKHLVEIRPITWKGKLPSVGGDYSGTYLRGTGELIMSSKIKVTQDQLKATDEIQSSHTTLTKSYLKGYLKKKWLNPFYGMI